MDMQRTEHRIEALMRERPDVTPALIERVITEHASVRSARARALRSLRSDVPVETGGVRVRNELVRSFADVDASGTLRVATNAQRVRTAQRLVRVAVRSRNALERAPSVEIEALEVAQERLGRCMWFARALERHDARALGA